MSLLTLLGMSALTFVAVGLVLVAVSDPPGLGSLKSDYPPMDQEFDPYAAEARAYLPDRKAA